MRSLILAMCFTVVGGALAAVTTASQAVAAEKVVGTMKDGTPIIANIDISESVRGWYSTFCEGDSGFRVEATRIIANPDTPAQKVYIVENTMPGYFGAADEAYGVEAGGHTFVFDVVKTRKGRGLVLYDEATPKNQFRRCS